MTKRSSRAEVIRRFPRFALDVDWFVESEGCSTLGRGLEVSVRGVRLLRACAGTLASEVTLYVALPQRARMFQARCRAHLEAGRGWVLLFTEVTPEDLQLLGHCLLCEFGDAALPDLDVRAPREAHLEGGPP